MPLPTLLIRGNLKPPTGDPALIPQLDQTTPIDYIVDWFRSRQDVAGMHNRVVVIKAETASGKSTAIPAYLYRDIIRPLVGTGDRRGVIITQPKILTAIENVKEMLKIGQYAEFLKLGKTIGWSTGPNKLRAESWGLLSATIGTLTAQLRSLSDEEFMDRYRIVLIDETHERDLATDLTIYMLKNLMLRQAGNPRCPFLALMSATFDPDPLLRYFGVNAAGNFIWCAGATAEIREMWDLNVDAEGKPRAVSNFIAAAASTVDDICRDGVNDPVDAGDILIFMPGEAEIKGVMRALDALNAKWARAGLSVASVLRIDSGTVKAQSRDYKLMTAPIESHRVSIGGVEYVPRRRIIVSTVVAETGLTLENLKYVIDAGFSRETEFNPVYGTHSLLTKPAPASRIRQRRGRVGRKFAGVFYPLYPKFVHAMLPPLQLPAILLSDVSSLILDIAHEQLRAWLPSSGSRAGPNGPIGPIFDPLDIDMIDPPGPDALRCGLEKCHALGFIAVRSLGRPVEAGDLLNIGDYPMRDGLGLTPLGACARCIGGLVPLESVRMIFAGLNWGAAVLDLISIAAFLHIATGGDIVMAAPEIDGKKQPKYSPEWEVIYKAGLPKLGTFSEGVDGVFRVRAVLADNMIDLLVICNAVISIVSARKPFEAREYLVDWCRRVRLDHGAIMRSLELREKLIETFLGVGIGVFANDMSGLAYATEGTLMDTVVRLKYCIYEGYRLNMLDEGVTRQGLETVGGSIYTPAEMKKYGVMLPKITCRRYCYAMLKIVAPRARKASAGKSIVGAYTVLPVYLSAMDGYVAVDPEFV